MKKKYVKNMYCTKSDPEFACHHNFRFDLQTYRHDMNKEAGHLIQRMEHKRVLPGKDGHRNWTMTALQTFLIYIFQ